ncbi:MAG: hypothetical protein JWO36_89 [Myxococcales bacterium]|nr:hypothetical protein [Myxococcales bacterium]
MLALRMAQIRYVDTWLRSPGSHPNHYRSVMVIAEKWAEQRVLMRAYAESRDQTRPTILLHGTELAIGPAGIDANGPWGIHVGDNPDGRAQAIKTQLEDSARRLSGSKGNPPRLVDESATFDREPTGNWGPGAPRLPPPAPTLAAPAAPATLRKTPVPGSRKSSRTRPPPLSARTALGYASGSGAQSAVVRLGLAPHVSARLGRLVERVVPADFNLDSGERRVLNALGEGEPLPARAIGAMLDLADAVSFMEEMMRKLETFGLGDLIEPAEPVGGEPTYRMRR